MPLILLLFRLHSPMYLVVSVCGHDATPTRGSDAVSLPLSPAAEARKLASLARRNAKAWGADIDARPRGKDWDRLRSKRLGVVARAGDAAQDLLTCAQVMACLSPRGAKLFAGRIAELDAPAGGETIRGKFGSNMARMWERATMRAEALRAGVALVTVAGVSMASPPVYAETAPLPAPTPISPRGDAWRVASWLHLHSLARRVAIG
jgi:hypothetical protein